MSVHLLSNNVGMDSVAWALAHEPAQMAWSGWLNESTCLQFTETLVHFAWQGTIVAIVLLAANALLRRASANSRYVAAVVAMGILAVCPPITFCVLSTLHKKHAVPISPFSEFPTTEARVLDASVAPLITWDSETEQLITFAEAPQTNRIVTQSNWLSDLSPYVTTVYLIGVATMLLRLSIGLRAGMRLGRESVAVSEESVQKIVNDACARCAIHAVPIVAYCQRVTVPVVVGIFRPMILLPPSLLCGLTCEQIEAILIHELAHICRWDPVINVAQHIVESVLFAHPAVWFVSHRIRVEREHACDDIVVASGRTSLDYVSALLQMADVCIAHQDQMLNPSSFLAASGGNPSQLKQRVLRLLGESPPPISRSKNSGVAGLLSAVFVLALTSAALIWAPTSVTQSPMNSVVEVQASHDLTQQPSQSTLNDRQNEVEQSESIGESLKPIKGTAEYRAALDLFNLKEYEPARKAFKKVAKQFKKSEIRQDALFMQAESAWNQEHYAQAYDAYAVLLKEYPATRHMNTVSERMFNLGCLWLEFPEVGTLGEIQKISFDEPVKGHPLEEPPKVPKKQSTKISNFGDKKVPLFDTAGNGVAALTSVWMHDPTGPLADDAMMLVASYHTRQGNQVAAKRYFQMLFETFPNSPHTQNAAQVQEELRRIEESKALILWKQVEFYVRKQNKRLAALHCDQIVASFPESQYAELARAKLDELGPEFNKSIVLGRLYYPRGKSVLERALDLISTLHSKNDAEVGGPREVAEKPKVDDRSNIEKVRTTLTKASRLSWDDWQDDSAIFNSQVAATVNGTPILNGDIIDRYTPMLIDIRTKMQEAPEARSCWNPVSQSRPQKITSKPVTNSSSVKSPFMSKNDCSSNTSKWC